MIVNKENASHYKWGDNCDSWVLQQSQTMIIAEEIMPPNTKEVLHFHKKKEQFFYILEGKASFFIEDKLHTLELSDGIWVNANIPHSISNKSEKRLRFILMSAPNHPKDRIDL